MKKKIVILGSTGSIGKNIIKIIKKDKKSFDIKLLSTNKNITEVLKQAKYLNVKNIIINDYTKYTETKEKYKKTNINFYNSFSIIDKLFKKKDICIKVSRIILNKFLSTTWNVSTSNKPRYRKRQANYPK